MLQDTPPQAAPAGGPATPSETVGHKLSQPIGRMTDLVQDGAKWLLDKGPSILAAILMLLAAWMIAGWVRKLVLTALTRAHIDLTIAKFFGNISKWLVIIFAGIACAGTFGINTTSFAAIIGAAGLAVGLALQGNLGNLASGVLLLIFRPFKIGDNVIVAGQTGVVDGIDLFTTNLDTADHRRIIVPNSAIFGGVIENQTRHPLRAVTVTVPVSPGANLDETRRLLQGVADKVVALGGGAVRDPGPGVALADLTPTVTWAVSVWVETPKFGAVRQTVLREIKLAVDGAGIAVGPAVTHIHVKSMPGA